MHDDFHKVRDYILDISIKIVQEIPEEGVLVLEDESRGVKNLIIDCEAPILIIEQFLVEIPKEDAAVYKKLLQFNRTLVHGAFVLDEDGKKLLFRDTLRIENLDFNEIEASIDALSLAIGEYMDDLIEFSGQA